MITTEYLRKHLIKALKNRSEVHKDDNIGEFWIGGQLTTNLAYDDIIDNIQFIIDRSKEEELINMFSEFIDDDRELSKQSIQAYFNERINSIRKNYK